MHGDYEVYLNGVPQQRGADYEVREGMLVFEAELRKDRINGWRWLLGAWGVGTYRQNDSVDVRYEDSDGSPRVAEGLEIELVSWAPDPHGRESLSAREDRARGGRAVERV